jgi:hypothetical protein
MIASDAVILKKSWTNKFNRTYPIGTILKVDNMLGSDLIKSKVAEKYSEEYPPKGKTKTEFFKPK